MLYQAVKNKISIEDILQGTSGNASQAQSSTSSLMNLVMQFRKVMNLVMPFLKKIMNLVMQLRKVTNLAMQF